MGTGSRTKTDLYHLHHYVQNTMISFPKERFIETLRDFFSLDSYYHYVRDSFGYPQTPDLTDVPTTAGLQDDVTTRLYIGEANRFDIIFYPALIIRMSSSRSVPISMNREKGTLQYKAIQYMDGYGNTKIVTTPSHFMQAGAWDGQITVDILSRALRSRDELTELVTISFIDENFDKMKNSGIVIKGAQAGGFTDSDDRSDKLFKSTVTFDIRSEWQRFIPVESLIDTINFCVDFSSSTAINAPTAPDLEITTSVHLINALQDL